MMENTSSHVLCWKSGHQLTFRNSWTRNGKFTAVQHLQGACLEWHQLRDFTRSQIKTHGGNLNKQKKFHEPVMHWGLAIGEMCVAPLLSETMDCEEALCINDNNDTISDGYDWKVSSSNPGRSSGRIFLSTHTSLTQKSWSGQTMPLSRHSVGTYPETSVKIHSASHLSPLSHCGHKSGISRCKLISTLKKKSTNRERMVEHSPKILSCEEKVTVFIIIPSK